LGNINGRSIGVQELEARDFQNGLRQDTRLGVTCYACRHGRRNYQNVEFPLKRFHFVLAPVLANVLQQPLFALLRLTSTDRAIDARSLVNMELVINAATDPLRL